VEIARGDLVEVTPASYGVVSRAFHFWSGEGRGDSSGQNLYENFAEATSGKGSVLPDSGVNFAADAMNMEREAKKEMVKRAMSLRGMGSEEGRRSAPQLDRLNDGREGEVGVGGEQAQEGQGDRDRGTSSGEEVLSDLEGKEQGEMRDERASECEVEETQTGPC
jgi:6-phosphofructo-2-kinase/fructose-2,6-biphosphatase 4